MVNDERITHLAEKIEIETSRRHILGSKIFTNNYWKYLEKKFFKKNVFQFFSKKVFFKSHNAEKLKKRPFRLIQRFLQTGNFKKMQGGIL